MPLTHEGKEVEKHFEKEYGKRGKSVFYAYMKKHPKETRAFHHSILKFHHHSVVPYRIKEHERHGETDRKMKRIALGGF